MVEAVTGALLYGKDQNGHATHCNALTTVRR